MSSELFWMRRLRWRLRGAMLWPAFAVLTVGDGLLLHFLPPNRTGVKFIPGLIVAMFANLFLVGLVAPWIARRLVVRERKVHRHEGRDAVPPEVIQDRTATILLALAAVGLFVAGLGNRPVVVSETKATETNARLVRQYVSAHAPAEVKANIDTANTKRLATGYFRTCVSFNDRAKAYCLFVDTKKETVVKDPDQRPNGVAFSGP